MKKSLLLILFGGLFLIPSLHSQNNSAGDSTSIDLNELEVPVAPGFILLDQAPTSIDKPNNAKAFAASIINSVKENQGLPKNYAAEFAPAWWFNCKNRSAAKYWGYNDSLTRINPFSALQYATVSLAFMGSSDSILNFSSGVRATILRFPRKGDLDELRKANENLQNAITTGYQDAITELLNEPDIQPNTPEYNNAVQQIIEQDTTVVFFEKQVSEIVSRKPVFSLDGALATNWSFENSSFSSGRNTRGGFWITGNFAVDLHKKGTQDICNYLNFYFTGRYLKDGTGIPLDSLGIYANQQLVDFGGKAEIEINRFALSFEFIERMNLTNSSQNTYRSNGYMRYKVKEGVYLNLALGKNFGSINNLISQFGLVYGIGSEHVSSK